MFKLKSPFKPTGDQPQAIEKLTKNLESDVKHQVLLGVTGSGKSLDYNEPIFVIDEDGSGKIIPIGKLIEEELKSIKGEFQEYETVCNIPKKRYRVLSFNPETFQIELKPVISFIRHQASRELYQLKTRCGRTAIITGAHNFYILRDEELKLVTTKEIKTGDYIPIPLGLFYSLRKEVEEINLLNFLANEKLAIKSDKFLKKIIKKCSRKRVNSFLKKYFKKTCWKCGAFSAARVAF